MSKKGFEHTAADNLPEKCEELFKSVCFQITPIYYELFFMQYDMFKNICIKSEKNYLYQFEKNIWRFISGGLTASKEVVFKSV